MSDRPVTVSRSHDLGRVSGPVVVDYRNGMKQHATLAGPVTLALDPLPPVAEHPPTFLISLAQDERGGHTVEWPSDVRWPARDVVVHALDEYGVTDPDGPTATRPATPEERAQSIAVHPDPHWRTLFIVYRTPFGLCAEYPSFFEPDAVEGAPAIQNPAAMWEAHDAPLLAPDEP